MYVCSVSERVVEVVVCVCMRDVYLVQHVCIQSHSEHVVNTRERSKLKRLAI